MDSSAEEAYFYYHIFQTRKSIQKMSEPNQSLWIIFSFARTPCFYGKHVNAGKKETTHDSEFRPSSSLQVIEKEFWWKTSQIK